MLKLDKSNYLMVYCIFFLNTCQKNYKIKVQLFKRFDAYNCPPILE